MVFSAGASIFDLFVLTYLYYVEIPVCSLCFVFYLILEYIYKSSWKSLSGAYNIWAILVLISVACFFHHGSLFPVNT